jgi:hypothetical protein
MKVRLPPYDKHDRAWIISLCNIIMPDTGAGFRPMKISLVVQNVLYVNLVKIMYLLGTLFRGIFEHIRVKPIDILCGVYFTLFTYQKQNLQVKAFQYSFKHCSLALHAMCFCLH